MENIMSFYTAKDFGGLTKATNIQPSRVFSIIEKGVDPYAKKQAPFTENCDAGNSSDHLYHTPTFRPQRVRIPSMTKRLYRANKRVRSKANRKAERALKLKYRVSIVASNKIGIDDIRKDSLVKQAEVHSYD